MKKSKAQITKLQEQVKRQMTVNGAFGMELNAAVVPEESEAADLRAQFKNSFQKELSYLKEENRILK